MSVILDWTLLPEKSDKKELNLTSRNAETSQSELYPEMYY